MAKLTDSEVRAIVEARARSALGSTEAEIVSDRELALDAYYGRPMGNEIDGRAQVVTKDLMDVIEWRMPSLMRVFASSESIQFDPVGPEDTELAKQETAYVRHVLWKKNPGFMLVYDWLKDGLQQKVGYVKYWWQDEERLTYDEYSGLNEDQLLLTMQTLMEQGEVEVVGSEQDDNGLWSIKVRVKKKYGCAKIEGAPPEELIIDAGCRGSIKKARFVGHLRTNVKRSDLIDLGYDRDRVRKLVSYALSEVTQGELARDTVGESRTDENGDGDWASEELTLLECYTYIDEDDDGIAELRRLLLAGNDTLEDDEAPEIQWESWTPYPVPHRHVGLSEYDRMEDLQRINTALARGVLDNVYFTMNPRLIYDKNTVDTVSLGINRPGGHVANDGPVSNGAAMPVPVNPMAGQILQVISYFNDTLEKRTGIGRNSMGVDADVLAQSTKGAYMDAKASANQMTEAIARIFAETGLASLYSSLHRLLSRHQDFQTRIKLGANWVEVNPTEWQERANLSVSVGLGNASKEEVRQNLLMMAQAQEKAASVPGLIQPKNVFALFRRMQTELGLENEDFITDPSESEPPQPQKDPYVQAEEIKAQTRMQEKQVDAQLKSAELAQERDLKITEMELDAGVDLAKAGIGAEVAVARGAQQAGGRGAAASREPANTGSVQ
jgi:hypothetical protein